MELFTIFLMTGFAACLCCYAFVSSAATNLYSARNLFLAVWFYYGFAVGIDILTGVKISYIPGEPDLMNPNTWKSVSFVMWNYVLLGVTFFVVYSICSNRQARPIMLKYDLRIPPVWLIVAIHVAIIYFYFTFFLGMSRMERLAMASYSIKHKFMAMLVPLILVLDIIAIMSAKETKARITSILMFPLAVVTGHRTLVLLAIMIAAYRWRPKVRTRFVVMAVSAGLMIYLGKTGYALALDWVNGIPISWASFVEYCQLSLADLDASPSYWIAMFYTDEPSPLWLGSSYTLIPLQITWPRFLGGISVETLAEQYVWQYHTKFAASGGGLAFSAVAEAWLNFGYVGTVIVGAFWGMLARFFDNRPRGISYYLFLMMIIRLFRSDFASLYKNWVLVWGTLVVVALSSLVVYSMIVDGRNPQEEPSLDNRQLAKPQT